jgi:hypothetical protein
MNFWCLFSFCKNTIVIKFSFDVSCSFRGRLTIAANVLGLCEEAELEAQMFSLVQMFIRIPNVQFSTEPAFLQNPC